MIRIVDKFICEYIIHLALFPRLDLKATRRINSRVTMACRRSVLSYIPFHTLRVIFHRGCIYTTEIFYLRDSVRNKGENAKGIV